MPDCQRSSRYSNSRAFGCPCDESKYSNLLLVAWFIIFCVKIHSRLCYLPTVQGTNAASTPLSHSIPSLLEHIFGQVGIDFMTDLPPSEGFDSIIVIVNHGLSKRVILNPCLKTGLTAEEMSRLYIDNVYSHFGF